MAIYYGSISSCSTNGVFYCWCTLVIMFDKSMMSIALKLPLIERALKTDILNVLLVYEMNYIVTYHCHFMAHYIRKL